MLLKPFTARVDGNGNAVVQIRHDLHGLQWKVYQIGFGLGILTPSPQVAAHVNGIPLASTTPFQPSAFSAIKNEAPYAMESFFNGPPYIILNAGDFITCAAIAATSGDLFTAGAIVDEGPVGKFDITGLGS